MAIQMQRGNVKGFQEKISSGSGLYLNAKDFEEARRIRPILWLYKGGPIDILTYMEGWHTVKGKDDKKKDILLDKPIRFETDEVIPDGIDWKMSSYKGGPMQAQTPKPNIAILSWDYKTKSLKVVSFHQANVVTQISAMLSDTDKDGKPNELFVDDLTQVDFIIKKNDDKNYSVTTQKPKDGVNLSKDCMNALADFEWSWEAFMQCVRLEDAETKYTYADVVDIVTSGQDSQETKKDVKKDTEKPKTKKVEKEVEESEEDDTFTYNKDWAKVKTPAGKILGEQSVDDLSGFKSHLEDRGKTKNNPLYDAIMSGIQDLTNPQGEDAEF